MGLHAIRHGGVWFSNASCCSTCGRWALASLDTTALGCRTLASSKILGWSSGEVACEGCGAGSGSFEDWGKVLGWHGHVEDGGNPSSSMMA